MRNKKMTKAEFMLFCVTDGGFYHTSDVTYETGYEGPEAQQILDEVNRVKALYNSLAVKPTFKDYQ